MTDLGLDPGVRLHYQERLDGDQTHAAWTTTITHATGDVFPATDWNLYIRDNLAFLHDRGADIASAATLAGITNQFHRVTGAVTITAITAPSGSGQGGNRLLLKFQSAGCAITAGAALILPNGPFVSAANGMIEFIWDDLAAAWVEVGRTFGQGLFTHKTTAKIVNTNVSEVDLLNAEFTLGGGVLGTGGMMRFTPIFDYLNNTGGGVTFRWRLKLGATTVFDSGALTLGIGAARGAGGFTAVCQNLGAANSQGWTGAQGFWNASAIIANNVAVGESDIPGGFGPAMLAPWYNTSTEDTATSKALVFSIQMGTSAALAEAKLVGATMEIIP